MHFPLRVAGRRTRANPVAVLASAPISESALQRSLIEYLSWAVPSVTAFAIPNAGRRTVGGRASNAVAGLRKGVSDFAIVLPCSWAGKTAHGVTAYIEVKTEKGRMSPEQKEWSEVLSKMSVPHCVVRSLEDLKEALRVWDVPTLDVSA